MLSLLYDFFYTNIFTYTSESFISDLFELGEFELFGVPCYLDQYLSFICSIVSIIFIVVLCCLFVYKIIKLVGGLIR